VATASVSVTFDCKSKDDAQTKVQGWKLHEGCKVSMVVNDSMPMAEADAKGKVKEIPLPEPTPAE
jgi:hypothetical protein